MPLAFDPAWDALILPNRLDYSQWRARFERARA
jgi:hypothetical protein